MDLKGVKSLGLLERINFLKEHSNDYVRNLSEGRKLQLLILVNMLKNPSIIVFDNILETLKKDYKDSLLSVFENTYKNTVILTKLSSNPELNLLKIDRELEHKFTQKNTIFIQSCLNHQKITEFFEKKNFIIEPLKNKSQSNLYQIKIKRDLKMAEIFQILLSLKSKGVLDIMSININR